MNAKHALFALILFAHPLMAQSIGEMKVEIGEFEIREIKKIQYLCEDEFFKPTGNFVESPICQVTLKLGEKIFEAAAEKEFCSSNIGSKEKLVLRNFECHTRFANICDENGKPTDSSYTYVGAMACEEGFGWVLRKDHQDLLNRKKGRK